MCQYQKGFSVFFWITLSHEVSRHFPPPPHTHTHQHTRTSRTFYIFAVHQPTIKPLQHFSFQTCNLLLLNLMVREITECTGSGHKLQLTHHSSKSTFNKFFWNYNSFRFKVTLTDTSLTASANKNERNETIFFYFEFLSPPFKKIQKIIPPVVEEMVTKKSLTRYDIIFQHYISNFYKKKLRTYHTFSTKNN